MILSSRMDVSWVAPSPPGEESWVEFSLTRDGNEQAAPLPGLDGSGEIGTGEGSGAGHPSDDALGEEEPWVEIFRAGDYGAKGQYSQADLEGLARDYDPRKLEAPLTLDHAQAGPAFGWVRSLRTEGDRLLAKLRGLAPWVRHLVRSESYRHPSVELLRRHGSTGRPYLRAVTLLGAASPAVAGLEPVRFWQEGSGAVSAPPSSSPRPALSPQETPRESFWEVSPSSGSLPQEGKGHGGNRSESGDPLRLRLRELEGKCLDLQARATVDMLERAGWNLVADAPERLKLFAMAEIPQRPEGFLELLRDLLSSTLSSGRGGDLGSEKGTIPGFLPSASPGSGGAGSGTREGAGVGSTGRDPRLVRRTPWPQMTVVPNSSRDLLPMAEAFAQGPQDMQDDTDHGRLHEEAMAVLARHPNLGYREALLEAARRRL
jgi:hypothetical protein